MLYAILADLVVGIHFAFVATAVAGGLAVLRWPGLAWAHAPILLWATAVELLGWPCPLTPLEQHLRAVAGQAGYAGGFLERYLWPLLYPPGLTRGLQQVLGSLLLVFNAMVYGYLWRRGRHGKLPKGAGKQGDRG